MKDQDIQDGSEEDTFQRIMQERLSRRVAMKTALGASVTMAMGPYRLFAADGSPPEQVEHPATVLGFEEIEHTLDATHHVAAGYNAEILIRWGDPVTRDSPSFEPDKQTALKQSKQFGYNNDFIGFFSLPLGSDNSDHGLLCVNHEYTTTPLMLPGYKSYWDSFLFASREDMETEMQAHGHSVIEVKKVSNTWRVVSDGAFNRRITATTPMDITGPVAGHKRLKTKADPTGRSVLGTLCNCAGGVTPWGTVLVAEEAFTDYFVGDIAATSNSTEVLNYESLRSKYDAFTDQDELPYGWHRFFDRFDINKEPLEFNRFGWMVEIDPFDPDSVPKKRTAMGRFMHEGATIVAEDGKPAVAYMGDDTEFQFIYKFVSSKTYRAGDRKHNLTLLEEGDLFAAKINADGSGQWLKLSFEDQFKESSASHLTSLQDVLIETRNAARALGATPMDRPEDVETNPVTGRTYVMLTKNTLRSQTNPGNPRTENLWGQILEILAPGVDGARNHWDTSFRWDLLLLAGNPADPDPKKKGRYHPDVSLQGWFSAPDNLSFDPRGNLWIATDGCIYNKNPDGTPAPFHDGLWACETTGSARALTKHFFGCPRGAEACGPVFTPDGKTLFVSVQHPGTGSGAVFASPSTRWPDFKENIPARPSVVVITKADGGVIGE